MRSSRVALALAGAAVLAAGLPARSHPIPVPHVLTGVFAQPLLADDDTGSASSTKPRYAYSIPRATADRPDAVDGRQVHVVYLLGSDSPDESLDSKGIIEMSMRAQNAWFKSKTGRTWIYDTFTFTTSTGKRVSALDVTFVRGGRPSSSLTDLDVVSDEVIKAGLTDRSKRYLIYAAAQTGPYCGEAYYPLASTDPNTDGQYSALYLDADPGCHSRDFATSVNSASWAEAIILQEMIHNDGVVPITSPHTCFTPYHGHVCTAELGYVIGGIDPEEQDVMFPFVSGPLSGKTLDKGNDDYYQVRLGYAMRDLEDSPYLSR